MTEPDTEARDVLAEALDDRKFRGAVSIDSRTDALIAALTARGYRLVSEPAPDVGRLQAAIESVRDVTIGELIASWERRYGQLPGTSKGATPIGPVFEELGRLRRIEAAARALDLRPERAVTDGNAIAALRTALEEIE